MTDPEAAVEIDLADLGDLVERLTTVARSNGVASMTVTHGGLTVALTLLPTALSLDPALPRPPDAAILMTSPPLAEAIDYVRAPMVGTYYAGSSPTEPPFVTAGDRIEVGETIGIIEAMKIMNEIPADVSGTVLEVLVTNGQAVEYGTPLFRIAPDVEEQP